MLPDEYGYWLECDGGQRFRTFRALIEDQTDGWNTNLKSAYINHRGIICENDPLGIEMEIYAYRDEKAIVSIPLDWWRALTEEDHEYLEEAADAKFVLDIDKMTARVNLQEEK